MDSFSLLLLCCIFTTVTAACSYRQYECLSGKCIWRSDRCDGDRDCPDGDDEDSSYCATSTCRDNEYRCSSGRCIARYWLCDGTRSCPDGADEDNCAPSTCLDNEYRCSSDRCIPRYWLCDGRTGHFGCSDGADEENCINTTCRDNEYRCSSGRCIPRYWLCDGDPDECPDGADEENCATSTCLYNEYRCSSGRCIPRTWLCDGRTGHYGCPDGEDERNCGDSNSCNIGCDDCRVIGCVACKRDFYFHKGDMCSKCSTHCILCTSETSCTKCNSGMYLRDGMCHECNRTCLECVEESTNCVIARCLGGEYSVNGSCSTCDDNCEECTGTAYNCTKCGTLYALSVDGESYVCSGWPALVIIGIPLCVCVVLIALGVLWGIPYRRTWLKSRQVGQPGTTQSGNSGMVGGRRGHQYGGTHPTVGSSDAAEVSSDMVGGRRQGGQQGVVGTTPDTVRMSTIMSSDDC